MAPSVRHLLSRAKGGWEGRSQEAQCAASCSAAEEPGAEPARGSRSPPCGRSRRALRGLAEGAAAWPRVVGALGLGAGLLLLVLWGWGRWDRGQGHAIDCVAYHQTMNCDPKGPLRRRFPGTWRGCSLWLKKQAGYCECTGGLATNLHGCGYHFYSCETECRRLNKYPGAGLKVPEPAGCNGDIKVADLVGGAAGEPAPWRRPPAAAEGGGGAAGAGAAAAGEVLSKLLIAYNAAAPFGTPEVPPRTAKDDFVKKRWRMGRQQIRDMRAQLEGFRARALDYPEGVYRGRGIVMVGGGGKYTSLAMLSVVQLRRLGSRLPVEMFFKEEEFPGAHLVKDLEDLGVTCRRMPDLGMRHGNLGKQKPMKKYSDKEGEGPNGLSRYASKIVAVLASGFEEVLWLDSDNIPLQAPDSLFADREYILHGHLLWPDVWFSSTSDYFLEIAGLSKETFGKRTAESGQLLYNKQKSWEALQLTFFLNIGLSYYKLLSDYVNQGDKETFKAGIRLAGQHLNMVARDPDAVGRTQKSCAASLLLFTRCSKDFGGVGLLQHGPGGQPLFLHSSMDKLILKVPKDYKDYSRRWETVMPGERRFDDVVARGPEGLERALYEDKLKLRCLSSLQEFTLTVRAKEMEEYEDYKGELLEEEKAPYDLRGFHTHTMTVPYHALAWKAGVHNAW